MDFEEEEELRFPEGNESLFSRDGHWQFNACLNFCGESSWGYIEGYKLAGDVMVQHIVTKRADQDTLVYPICFNYRHYIELALKQLIRDARHLTDAGRAYPTGHVLMSLWKSCRPLLAKVYDSSPQATLDNVERLVAEFDALDAAGMSFRYWEDLKGNPSLPRITHINLHQLALTMQKLANFFECCQAGISAHLDFKSDMEAEYQQYAETW